MSVRDVVAKGLTMGSIFMWRRKSKEFALRTTKAKVDCVDEIQNWFVQSHDGQVPPQAVSDFLQQVADTDDTWIHSAANTLPADLLDRAREWTHLLGEAIPLLVEEGRINSDQALIDANALMDFFPDSEPPFEIHSDCREYRDRGAADCAVAQGLMIRCYRDAHSATSAPEIWQKTVVVATTIWIGWLTSSERQTIPSHEYST